MNQISLPQEWYLKKISDLCEVVRGGSPRPKGDPRYFGGPIPWIKISDATENTGKFIISTKEGLKKEGVARSRFLKAGTLVLTNSATICLPKILQIDGCIHDGFLAFLNLDSTIDKFFLYYYFLWRREHVSKNIARGLAQKNLNTSLVKNLLIPLPPIETQKNIVQKLNYIIGETEEKKTKLDLQSKTLLSVSSKMGSFKRRLQNNTNLEYTLIQSVLTSAFSGDLTSDYRMNNSILWSSFPKNTTQKNEKIDKWTCDNYTENQTHCINAKKDLPKIPSQWYWTDINSISIFIGSGITPLGGRSVYLEQGIPFIRSQNVYPGELRLDDVCYISSEMHKKMSRTSVLPGDVLLNITGASIGRCTFVPSGFGPANLNQHVCIIRTNNSINPEFLCWWLNSSFIQKKILQTQRGQTREGLNYTHIRSLPIPLTIMEEQNEIIRKIKAKFLSIESIKYRLNVTVKLHERVKTSLSYIPGSILDRAFSGKLLR